MNISYQSILEIIHHRRSALIKLLSAKDRRRTEQNHDLIFARLEECDIFISLIKDRITDESDKPESFIRNITSGVLQQRGQSITKTPLVISDEGKKDNHVFDIGGDIPDFDPEEVLK